MQNPDGTLFHFTDSYENLVGILKNEFKPRFCLEETDLTGFTIGSKTNTWAVPMVCFCDLRLSQIREHLEIYGGYGIGLSKSWGKKNGLSPLIYLHDNSRLTELLKNNGLNMVAYYNQPQSDKQDHSAVYNLMELGSFIKPYSGTMYRKGQPLQRCFYEEREWRYVPHFSSIDGIPETPWRLRDNEYFDEEKRIEANSAISDLDRLGFDPMDICYLFVKEDEEIIPLVHAIRDAKNRYGAHEVTLLTTRIMTSNRIPLDF